MSTKNNPTASSDQGAAEQDVERLTSPARTKPSTRKDTRKWLLRQAIQSGAVLATVLIGIVLIGFAQRIGWIQPAGSSPSTSVAADQGATATVYTCPMHPEIRQDKPGKCPICGMELVPATDTTASAPTPPTTDSGEGDDLYVCPMMCTPPHKRPGRCPVCNMELVKSSGGQSAGRESVVIDPAARRILGIRTAEATTGEVYRTIRSVGKIEYDQERVATIAAYVDGRIEEMFAEYVGVPVAKGDDLVVLYSPHLYTAQVEYLSALSTPSLNALAGGELFSEVARDNLRELGLTESQIETLEETEQPQKRLRIKSSIGGTVIAKNKVEGDYVKTGDVIYRVVDLSRVWLMLELFPGDAVVVRFGQPVEAEVQSWPGEVFRGRIAFVDPVVDEMTRTVSVRVEMPNTEGRLKPGDYATAQIRVPAIPRDQVYDPEFAGKWISPMHPQIVRDEPGPCPICGMDLVPTSDLGYADEPLPKPEVVTVPRSAVLMAGSNSVAYVEVEPGKFELRRVTLGPLTDTQAIILDGIQAGEQVAVDGNFLIDSQMQLSGKPSLLDPSRGSHSAAENSKEAGHAH